MTNDHELLEVKEQEVAAKGRELRKAQSEAPRAQFEAMRGGEKTRADCKQLVPRHTGAIHPSLPLAGREGRGEYALADSVGNCTGEPGGAAAQLTSR